MRDTLHFQTRTASGTGPVIRLALLGMFVLAFGAGCVSAPPEGSLEAMRKDVEREQTIACMQCLTGGQGRGHSRPEGVDPFLWCRDYARRVARAEPVSLPPCK